MEAESNMLGVLWKRICDFQRQVYGVTWPRSIDEQTKQYATCLAVEAVELLDETSFKSHKRPKLEINLPAIQGETVDIFIYDIAQAAIVFDSPEAFLEAVRVKMGENEERLRVSLLKEKP